MICLLNGFFDSNDAINCLLNGFFDSNDAINCLLNDFFDSNNAINCLPNGFAYDARCCFYQLFWLEGRYPNWIGNAKGHFII